MILEPKTVLENLRAGLDRACPGFLGAPGGDDLTILNLGAGKKSINGAINLDADMGWQAPKLPSPDGSVKAIYMYHFLEHLEKETILQLLKECERVLIPGGIINTVTPFWRTEAAHQDLDHKSFWTESTWKNLFENPYYDGTMPRNWYLKERATYIMGVVERNLMVVSQLVRVAADHPLGFPL